MTAADRPSVTDNARAEGMCPERIAALKESARRAGVRLYEDGYAAGLAAGRAETTTATTEDAARVIGDAIRQRLSWASLHWDLNDPDDEGWPHIVASIFHALTNEGLLAQPLPETTTEWGVRLPEGDVPVASEDAARRHLSLSSLRRALRREVTAWTEVDR